MSDELSAPEEKQRWGPRSNQKLKILYLAKILLEYTDAKNDITLQDIIDKLAAYNVTAERKSLYDDIAQLNDFGIKIKKTQYGRTSHYQVINRDFEEALCNSDIEPEGKFHDGLDDAINTGYLIEKLEKCPDFQLLSYAMPETEEHLSCTIGDLFANLQLQVG